ncbi:hypothetical protein [Rugosimonospora africana]|uniref:Uncharacterized protein n=1 Tax=Rugosimonospora africana TaxID=556532 RepID=A0A8J3R3N3_9ACTN|nr:hypothetical protein [Rugosimonospora africana]GIH20795.1 hypothetical protein Raf01_89670 [Rugosimonospora africana]
MIVVGALRGQGLWPVRLRGRRHRRDARAVPLDHEWKVRGVWVPAGPQRGLVARGGSDARGFEVLMGVY